MAALALITAALLIFVAYFYRRMKKKKDYFTIEELEASATAKAKGIDNTAPAKERAALTLLKDNVLNPARKELGLPVYVNSGYRSPALNTAVGGAVGSQHEKGEAADLDTRKGRDANKRLFEIIKAQGNFDQLINEHDYSWVHVSYSSTGNQRHQVLAIA